MSSGFWEKIDWQQPWLSALLPIAAPILHAKNWRFALNEAALAQGLRNHRGLPLQFVPQAELPAGVAYEAYISASGQVPTRDNLHDFFNGLVWLRFPQIKVQLNALQAAEISKAVAVSPIDQGVAQKRGRLRDAATIFDENAALLVTHNAGLLDAIRNHRWFDAFVTDRQAFERDCEVFLFGHALMEKLVSPYKAITAHAWPVIVDAAYFSMPAEQKLIWLDSTISKQLASGMRTADFTPLPVLGLPGWSKSQDSVFYNDEAVFRPKRVKS